MSNKFQENIAEIRRAQKRLQTAKKTIDKSHAVIEMAAKLLTDKPSYRRTPVPAHQLAKITSSKELKKDARKLLRNIDMVMDLSASLVKQSGVRPYRKRKNQQKSVAIH